MFPDNALRKRRGKKKGRGYNSLRINQATNEEETDTNMEELNNDSERSGNQENILIGVEIRDLSQDVEDCEIMDEDVNDNDVSVSVDGVMKAPPQILEPEPYEKNEPEPYEKNEPETYDKNEDAYPPVRQESLFTAYNNRALSKYAVTYELEKFKKNYLIIFNQENVDGFKPRYGTERDVQALTNTFSNYGFEVYEHKDFTKDEVFRELRSFSERDFTDYGCVAIAVLTHGSYQGLLWAKDQLFSEIEIINYFKVYDKPTLVTKPKILMIQACRGKDRMVGVPVLEMANIRRDYDESLEPYTLPAESDMLILHSSYIGHASHRDKQWGSWFIQTLCHKINQMASSHDLESIVTEVKREVAIEKYHVEYNRRTFETDINKQMPVTTSTLIRKLYFKKFGDESPHLTPSYSEPGISRNEVLDNSSPSTPLPLHFGSCSCFLDHFYYVRKCLRYHLEENPHDGTAKSYLDISESFEDSTKFNTLKRKMAKAISDHLSTVAREAYYYKYLYFYKNEND